MTGRNKARPVIDYTACTGCRDCITFCPFGCLELNVTGKDSYRTVFPGLTTEGNKSCTSCGICANKCPIGVITMVEPN